MKRWIFLAIIILVIFGQGKNQEQPKKVFKSKNPMPAASRPDVPYHTMTKKLPPVTRPERKPAAISRFVPPKKLVGLKLGSTKIGKSYQVVEGVVSIPAKDYSPQMGKSVYERQGFVFFRPVSVKKETWPVAIHPSTQRLFPISHILHVKGADPVLRNQLVGTGMKEFYYHPKMQLLSLQSTPSSVLKHYEELKRQGLDVRLEVLKDPIKGK